MARYTVDDASDLMGFLRARAPKTSASEWKKRLKHKAITVNGVPARHDTQLAVGDVVDTAGGEGPALRANGVEILHADRSIVVIEKPAGLPSVPNDVDDGRETALSLARALLERREKGVRRLFAVHRLDRETSGVLLLARDIDVRERVMATWGEVEKRYVAIVEGHPRERAFSLSLPLRELANLRVVVGDGPGARDAITHVTVEATGLTRARLDVRLETGRKHQIRVSLAHIGHPVVGDETYGAREPGFPRHALHAAHLAFTHPATGERMTFQVPAPAMFATLLGRRAP